MTPALALAAAFARAHPDQVARLADTTAPIQLAPLLSALAPPAAARLLQACTPRLAAEALCALPGEQIRVIGSALGAQGLAALTLSLSADERSALLAPLEETDRRALEQLVRYGPSVAGGVAEPRVACVHEDASVARALETLHGDAQAAHYYVYVVGRGHKLSGVASLRSLLLAEPASRVVDVMAARPEHIPAAATLSTLAVHPGWSRFSALPVVAPSGELVGVIRYARYREIVESLGQGGRAPDQTASTVAALAEVYSVGTSALVSWVGASLAREGSDGQ